ncbi:alpha/beta fold hydrolase [Prochlorococcus sp. MIT 1307]|uniref:alpha/beta fold hydrolase n=1 Tax=Prochlorococcus sp. MIT 1307 TaxID=3096219 RepID=UPI002A74745C|nr:alpha/beta fold hydrolase [Prochlorococcus sp. MIT 1307]
MEECLFHSNSWRWHDWKISWNSEGCSDNSSPAIVLIHGFGACKEHWRHNQPVIGKVTICYAIDLIGFGNSSQPNARLQGEKSHSGDFTYGFDAWSKQVADFCTHVVQKRVILVGNSIGGVIALRAGQLLKDTCCGVVLIDCAQRTMDDKRLNEQPNWMKAVRPVLKTLVRQRWLSGNLFRNAANPTVIRRVLMQAYPSKKNIDEHLINLLHTPSKRTGAKEAFRGFINLFDDYLAPDLMKDLETPVDMIWGDKDPWEPVEEAKRWLKSFKCIRSLEIIPGAGHCPHDEAPEHVNRVLLKLIQHAT